MLHALRLLAKQEEASDSVSDEKPFDKAKRLGLIGAANGLPADLSSKDHMDAMLDDVSPEEAIATIGIGPSVDLDAGAAKSWPKDEPIGDWIAELNALRRLT